MFKTILVPIDGSPYSERALLEAQGLATAGESRIELVSVLLESPASVPHVPKLDQAAEDATRNYLAGLAHSVSSAGFGVGQRVRRGNPAAEIVATAQEVHADLIVMASHGVGAAGPGAPSYGLGGVAFKVLHDAPCPVFVLPIRLKR